MWEKKDDQPFTELLNRFRTPSQTEGDIQCSQSRLVHHEDTDYPVSIVLYFWDSFFFMSCLFFISLNCFFSKGIFFSADSIALKYCSFPLFNHLSFSFLSNTLHEHVVNGIPHRPKVLYFSSIFLEGSHSIYVFSVLNRGRVSFIIKRGNTDILIFLWV